MQRGSRSQTNRESVFVKCGARSVRWQMIAAKAPLASPAAAANRHKLFRRVESMKWPHGRSPFQHRTRGSYRKPARRKVFLLVAVLCMFVRWLYSMSYPPVRGYRIERLVALRMPAGSCFFVPSPRHHPTRKSHCARRHAEATAAGRASR